MQIWNRSNKYCWIYLINLINIQSRHNSVHRQTDRQMDRRMDRPREGQTDKVKPVYPPFNFIEAGGITINSPFFNTLAVLSCFITIHWCSALTWYGIPSITLRIRGGGFLYTAHALLYHTHMLKQYFCYFEAFWMLYLLDRFSSSDVNVKTVQCYYSTLICTTNYFCISPSCLRFKDH